jgi:alanyl-tRNA synthetase
LIFSLYGTLLNLFTSITGKYVIHYVRVAKGSVSTGESGKLNFDETRRLQCMQNHSATHLLNAALHKLFPDTYQRSSSVTPDHLTFDFSSRGALKDHQIEFIEEFVRSQIKAAIPIKRKSVNLSELSADTIKIPGEAYPESVFLISMSGDSPVSSEPCCGTHCNNTFDVIEFCITADKSAGSGVRSLRALSGNSAIAAVQIGKTLERKVEMVQEFLDSQNYHSFEGHKKIKEIKQNLADSDIPLLQKKLLVEKVEKMEKKVMQEL